MTESISRRPALQNDLYIRSEELPGASACDGQTAEEAERNAEALVHQLIVEEKRRTKPTHLPEIVPQVELAVDDDPQQERESARASIAQILKAEREAPAPEPRQKSMMSKLSMPRPRLPKLKLPLPSVRRSGAARAAGRRFAIPDWLRSYRPTRKHITLAVLAGIMLYRPLLIPLVLLLVFWVVLIAYLSLGPDRWAEILSNGWLRLKARRPALAERLRLKADRAAEKWDKILDRLPEAWAERLALPDFSDQPDPEDRPDPFDRLAAEAREA